MTPENGVPKGIRTPVTAVKGRCPRPLDDGDKKSSFKSFAFEIFCKVKLALRAERHYPYNQSISVRRDELCEPNDLITLQKQIFVADSNFSITTGLIHSYGL